MIICLKSLIICKHMGDSTKMSVITNGSNISYVSRFIVITICV